MTIKDALLRLKDREDWDEVLDYRAKERDAALMDFQHSDLTDNPHKLAKLAGGIAAIDRVLRVLSDD
jgi:hypothetical protein